jgi:hypothetical protein
MKNLELFELMKVRGGLSQVDIESDSTCERKCCKKKCCKTGAVAVIESDIQ